MKTIIGVILIGLGFVGLTSVYTVQQAEQALVLQFGDIKAVRQDPGLYFKLPYQNVITYDKRLLPYHMQSEEVIVEGNRRLVVDAVLRYRITDPLKFYQRVVTVQGLEGRLNSISDSALRGALGDATVEEVITENRTQLMRKITEDTNRRASDLGVEVYDIRIIRADLPRQNSQAVVQRMITERQREAAEERANGEKMAKQIRATADRDRTIILAEAEKQSQILRGEGEAERNRVFAEAFSRDPAFFEFYRSMQAYRASLKASDTSLVLSPESEFFKYFSDAKGKK
ncbi:MAG: protease modulator HflC [Alphaproteobacteria bacterium]|nr:MAG: protease modulator HflC [Alphaproteobacteria bacterium]